MAYNSISGYSTTRLTGLSSGLDTDSLIKAAMAASQSKLDRMYQNKTSLEWKRDAYTDVRTKVSTFSQKYMSSLSPDNIFSKSAYKQYKVSLSDKYDSYFSVKGTSNAQAGSHKITQATLAKTATLQGAKYRNRVAGLSGATNTNTKAGSAASTELYVKQDDGSYKALSASDLSSSTELKDVYIKDSTAEDGMKQAFGASTSFSVNGKTINVSKLGDMKTQLDKAGVQLSVSEDATAATGKLVFTGNATGVTGSIEFTDTTSSSMTQAFGKNGTLGITELKSESLIQDPSSMKLSDLVAARNQNKAIKADGSRVENLFNDGNFEFKIGDGTKSATIKLDLSSDPDKNLTVQGAVDKINQQLEDAGVKVKMGVENGQFTLRSTDSSATAAVETENVKGNFFGGGESLTGIAVDKTSGYQDVDRAKDTIASAAAKMGVNLSNGKDTISFKINGQEFTFNKNTTLDKMMSEINSNADLKVRMTYSQITDSFELSSLETGHTQNVTFETTDPDAQSLFGFTQNDDGTYSARGTDATLTIDGETITRSSNKFVIDGMEITLKDDFVAANADLVDAAGNALKPSDPNLGVAKFSVEQDVDGVVDKVKAFVTAYNELVDSLYKMTTEAKDYDYEPLTEDQRANMEKEDIEKWETEAKKGVLRNDTAIRSFLSKMRSAIFEKVGGVSFGEITGENAKDQKGLSAYDIGFNTTAYAAGEYGGKITFNEEKFRAALERDPEVVANIMAQVSDASDKATEYKESGFVTKLYDSMSDFVSTMRGKNIQNVNKQISDANKAMENQIKKMYEQQERLYKQYAALETLMSSYQSQTQWMTQQFAALTGTGSN